MENLKRLLMLLVALVATTAFVACGDDDDDSGNTISGLKVTATELTFTKDGGTQTFSVQSDATFSVGVADAPWLTVQAGTMSQNLKVTPITVTAAPMTTETQDRTATITIATGTQRATVSVTQLAGDVIIVSPAAYSVGAEGGTVSIGLTANGDYTATTDAAWLAVGQATATACTLTAAANTAGQRTATVTFTRGTATATATVTQEAGQQGTISGDALSIARQMYPAWNLGNTLEGGNNANLWTNNGGLGAETSWQGTKTTQAIIDFVKEQGFKAVRIPTAWVMGHITSESAVTIDAGWMARVHEIVDYCISDGLYVVLNDHWDGGWLENSFSDISSATVAKKSEQLRKLWTQIATEFRDYDEHLLFAGLNEPGMGGSGFTAAATTALLQYEQAFIDAVRATGGNNAQRILVVQGPETDIEQTTKESNNYDLGRLSDPAGSGRLMVEVHCYTPWVFCGLTEDASWGKMRYYWGTGNGSGDRYYANGESELQTQFRKMYAKFASKGWPVILGECGANYRFTNDERHDASIRAWYKTITEQAISNGCIPFYWDTNYTGLPNMTIINRATLKVNNQHMLGGIQEGLAAATWPL